MSGTVLLIVVLLVIAGLAVAYGLNEKLERIDADAAWANEKKRADNLQRIIDQSANLTGCKNCAPGPEWDHHEESAREVAEPTPDLHVVRRPR